jgi:hypothetical protein
MVDKVTHRVNPPAKALAGQAGGLSEKGGGGIPAFGPCNDKPCHQDGRANLTPSLSR